MNTFINRDRLNFTFLSFPLHCGITFLFHLIMTSQLLLAHFFISSEILKSFQAKPQSKSILWFNFSYMGKTNRSQKQI